MFYFPDEDRYNCQVMYWDHVTKAVQTQDPGTIREVLKCGVNIYPLLSLDLQIINAFRQNAAVTLTEKLNLFPNFGDVVMAGTMKLQTPPLIIKDDFIAHIATLRQNRWNSVKLLGLTSNEKLEFLHGKHDSLSDNELYALAKCIHSENVNVSGPDPNFVGTTDVFSLFQPETIKDEGFKQQFETPAERSFIFACKPEATCDPCPKSPYWRDSFDFNSRHQRVLYKLAEKEATTEWKKDRQEMKHLNVHLPLSIDFRAWKDQQEHLKKKEIRINYQRILQLLDLLIEDCTVPDFDIADRIAKEEFRLQDEIRNNLNKLWKLQKEKKVAADGELFDMKMVNPWCLPYINQLLPQPKGEPTVIIQLLPESKLLVPNEYPVNSPNSSDWTGEWSSDESLAK